MLSKLDEVLDYENLMLNGTAANIVVNGDGVPILKEVRVIAAD